MSYFDITTKGAMIAKVVMIKKNYNVLVKHGDKCV